MIIKNIMLYKMHGIQKKKVNSWLLFIQFRCEGEIY